MQSSVARRKPEWNLREDHGIFLFFFSSSAWEAVCFFIPFIQFIFGKRRQDFLVLTNSRNKGLINNPSIFQIDAAVIFSVPWTKNQEEFGFPK